MSLIRNYVTTRKWHRHGWDFVQKAYRGVSVSAGFAMIDMKIFQVRLIYTHPILMHVFCLTFKIFGWFYYSRRNKAQFDTLYSLPEISSDFLNVSHSERNPSIGSLYKVPPMRPPAFSRCDVIADKAHSGLVRYRMASGKLKINLVISLECIGKAVMMLYLG